MYQLNQIPSEAQIRKLIRKIRFGKNVFCPICKGRRVFKYENRYRCRDCRKPFSLLSGTWLSGTKLPYRQLWALLWCWQCRIPVKQARALLKLSDEAVRGWYRTFRLQVPETAPILDTLVQMDEAYGKGWTLVLAKQINTRKLAYVMLPGSVQRHHALAFVGQHIAPGSRVNTDGAAIYKKMEQWWPVTHQSDIHSKFEFAQTSEIEGMFGCFRTFIRRMYHHGTAAKMPEYVREFCARFSSPEMFENPRVYLLNTLSRVPID